MARRRTANNETKVDMTPMIDMVFLLIIFFILAGKISADITNELITVPPTKTSVSKEIPQGWSRIRIEVHGKTQNLGPEVKPKLFIKMGTEEWVSEGSEGDEAMNAYRGLRTALNRVFDEAKRYKDPKSSLELPQVILELRADADTEYRVIQEIQQIATDGNDPWNNMLPVLRTPPKPFVHFHFTTHKPEGGGG